MRSCAVASSSDTLRDVVEDIDELDCVVWSRLENGKLAKSSAGFDGICWVAGGHKCLEIRIRHICMYCQERI